MTFINKPSTEFDRIETDPKRYLWLLSLTIPAIPVLTVFLYIWSEQNTWALAVPLLYSFVVIPILDMVIGEDTSNPSPEMLEEMETDQYYRTLLHLSVPLFWLGYLIPLWLVGTHDLSLTGMILLAVGTGYSNGTALTVGHELGHKHSRLDRWMAKLACAISGYGHFCIEHNRGHHTWVATPEDIASARFNETIYGFSYREIPGAIIRGWKYEAERLARKGRKLFSPHNDILQGYAITATVTFSFLYIFGWKVLPFILIASVFGWYALTEANYVEHYGLKRTKLANGKYELCQPNHSWNTNHIVSNLMLFHLQRHSDHHANPLRPYQALRNFNELPRLPSGYPGCFVLAAIPPLWFKIMNPKVLAWAGGDMVKINTGIPNISAE